MGLRPGWGWGGGGGVGSFNRLSVNRTQHFQTPGQQSDRPPSPGPLCPVSTSAVHCGYSVGPSRYGQVPKNPGVTLSTEHLPLPAASSASMHTPLQSILGVPTSRRRASRTGPHRTSSHCRTRTSLVSGSRGPREPGDRLKEQGGAVGSPQAVGPEKIPGSKELMHRLRPSNPGSRRLSKPQVLHL